MTSPTTTREINEGVRKELEAFVEGIEIHAEKILTLYGDLGLEGERESAAFKRVARDLRKRIESLYLV